MHNPGYGSFSLYKAQRIRAIANEASKLKPAIYSGAHKWGRMLKTVSFFHQIIHTFLLLDTKAKGEWHRWIRFGEKCNARISPKRFEISRKSFTLSCLRVLFIQFTRLKIQVYQKIGEIYIIYIKKNLKLESFKNVQLVSEFWGKTCLLNYMNFGPSFTSQKL